MKAIILYLDMQFWISIFPYSIKERDKYYQVMNDRLMQLHGFWVKK